MPQSHSIIGLGIGHLPILHDDIVKSQKLFDFVEVTPEAFIGSDPDVYDRQSKEIASTFKVSCHGIDMSFASADPVNDDHLNATRTIANLCNASFFSEHMAFTKAGALTSDIYFPPVYIEEEVDRLAQRCRSISAFFSMPFHLENVPDFFFGTTGIGEGRFFTNVTGKAGNGIILNIDSISISARLQGRSPEELIAEYPSDRIVSLTVVPESCMNPIIKQFCGGFDTEMLSIVSYCLRHTSAESILIQTRYAANTVNSLSEVISSLRSVLEK